ncbi:hypothetical protein CROQUDRAFT_47431 [Cronartium quercuum f. sp. fusiforme G11]|uniref:Multifunctional tryptophan biosynthesis protein n=1 Tax=Cronartium quercuum f. sp. fusiforme G11 TaxID=708437 RepID=A0A9P6NIS7_9BASI|nr:hypothetical protein CROQUDRAFT_47431 [Cronartium quercuum f. sp. fusiforme G11]
MTTSSINILMLDNYDSFTWNLYQYLSLLGANVTVIRSQSCTLEELIENHPSITHLVISPGPGHPTTDAGISIPTILHYAGKIPILGICMGLQCIYTAFGGIVDSVGTIVHGKTSKVFHDQKGLFKSITQGIQSTRYHSLAGNLGTLPEALKVTAWSNQSSPDDPKLYHPGSIIMAVRHKTFTIEAVQYHPESILSEEGKTLLNNFLKLKGGSWAENEQFGITSTTSVGQPSTSNSVSPTSIPAPSLPTILQSICRQRLLDIAEAKKIPGSSPIDLKQKLKLHISPVQIDFYQRIKQTPKPGQKSVALMAEIKRASPSKGSFVTDSTPPPPQIALSYALAGASTISVLTEPTWFKGTLMDMLFVRLALEHVPNRPAILRKDFILDTYQIDEARCYGADTILLIVACLSDEQLKLLFEHAKSLGMEPLVEVNNAIELERALKIGSRVIGVNNRNLHDFNVDMSTTTRMVEAVRKHDPDFPNSPSGIILCALSGISSRADVERYVEEGVGAVLVGESLMKAPDKRAFVHELLGIKPATEPFTPLRPLVKICGIKTPEQALQATMAGADLIGLIFVPTSKRYVTLSQAKIIIQHVRNSYPSTISDHITIDQPQPQPEQHFDWFAFQTNRLQIQSKNRKPLFVGVFQDSSLDEIIHYTSIIDLDFIQLHGQEPIQLSKFLTVPVIKTFHINFNDEKGQIKSNETLKDIYRSGFHSLPLIDSQINQQKGGTGKSFDWSILNSILPNNLTITMDDDDDQMMNHNSNQFQPFILAGGLNSENVGEAIKKFKPIILDVSSSVENLLTGEKEIEKIKKFIKSVETACFSR